MTSPATESCPPKAPAAHQVQRVRHPRAHRIGGMILRHLYLLLGSWARLIDLMYWPTLNMLIWGFLNRFINLQNSGIGIVAGVILGAAMLWDVFLRSQLSLFQSFMEEIWSRNFGHIFVSPMTPAEYGMSLILLSVVRVTISITPCLFFAFVFFQFWLPGLGWPALLFAINLAATGWWGGLLLVSLIFRFGYAAEWLAWMAMFIMAPLCAVYYPVSVLPDWLQVVANILPPTHVFEGLRALLNDHVFESNRLILAAVLNLLYMVIGFGVYYRSFEATRRDQGLLQTGE